MTARPRGPRLRLRQVRDVAALAPYVVLAPLRPRWQRRWGATPAEVAAALPGDDLLDRAHFRATRAIDVAAPPEAVWPWLVQVGSSATGRAGFYAADLVDNLGVPSAEEVLAPWQRPAVGDLAAPMTPRPGARTSFRVAEVDAPRTLVWANADCTWAWTLTSASVRGRAGTRLVTRFRVRYRRRPSDVLVALAFEVGDLAMVRAMLRGIRRRAEALHRSGSR